MTIKYKYVPYDNPLSKEKEEQKIRPIALAVSNADTQEVIDQIAQNNFYTRPEAVKAVEVVFYTIEQLLREGRSVTIDGYGTFMITAQFVKETIDNSDPMLKEKSISRRAESIEVKNVVFRATPKMKRRIGVNNFERQKR